MIYKTRILAFVIILSTAYTVNIFSQQKLYIENGKEDYSVGKYISVLEDKQGTFTIEQACSDSMNNKYVFYNQETLNFKFTTSAYWIKFIIVDTLSTQTAGMLNSQIRNWILIKNEPVIEDIRLYYRDNSKADKHFIERNAGSIIPVKDKFINTNDYVATFPVQRSVPDTIYLRVQTRSQFIISFNILTTGEYVKNSSNKYFFHGILFGIFFLLIAYNLLLYFSVKDKTYILYVCYVFFYMIMIFTYKGYYFEIFGRTFSRDYFIIPMASISVGGVFWLLLTREFLMTKIYLPKMYKILTYLIPIAPLTCFLTFALYSPPLAAVTTIILIGYYLVGFIAAILSLIKGVEISKYYLLALTGMVVGVFITFAARNVFIPIGYTFWTQNAASLGLLWEALILAATVGYRFNILKIEKGKEKALMRNQIAADLHDEIGSNLSTISLQSRLMMKAQQLDDDSKKQLQEITNIAGITTDTIRDIVWFINPFHDKSEDLLIRMKELASKMLINLNYNFSSSGNNELIFDLLPDLNKRRHIYLIFKEILNNVIKHSDANEVSILLSTVDKKFIMIVADNGKGFNEDEIIRGEGLRNLRNRAVQAGAQILIESNTGRGTKITLDVPL